MGIKDISNEGIYQSQKSFGGELAKTFVNNDDQLDYRISAIKRGVNMICGQSQTARSRLGTQALCLSRHPMFTIQIGLYTIVFKGVNIHDRNSTEDDEVVYSIYYDVQPLKSTNDAWNYVENLDRKYADNSEDLYTKMHNNTYFTDWKKLDIVRSDKITTAKPRLDFNKLQHHSVLIESRNFWRIGFYFGIVDYNFDLSSIDPKFNKFVVMDFVPKRTTPTDNEYLLDQIEDFSTCILWENALVIADRGYVFISVDAGIQFDQGKPTTIRDSRYDFNTFYATVEEINVKEVVYDQAGTPTGKNLISVVEGAFRLQFTGKGTLDNVITNLRRFRDLVVVTSTNHVYKLERIEKNNAYSSINYITKLIYNEGCKRGNLISDFNRMYFANVNGLYMIVLKDGLTLDINTDVYVISVYSQHKMANDIIKLGLRRYRGDANLYMHHLDGDLSIVSVPSIIEKNGATGIPRITSRTAKNGNERYENEERDFYYYINNPMHTTVVARFLKAQNYTNIHIHIILWSESFFQTLCTIINL